MQMRKTMAVVLSVALALMLALTGCGRKPVTNVLMNLLSGHYKNVTVAADKELENTLRRAVKENGTPEQTARALEKTLGSTVSFDGLRSGQKGDHTFDLVFRAGGDADAAARKAFQKWDPVFGTLPANGQYQAALAMIQTQNGCYILLETSVDRAGTTAGKSGKGGKSSDSGDSGKQSGSSDGTVITGEKEGRDKKESDPLVMDGVSRVSDNTYYVKEPESLQPLFQKDPELLNGKTIQLEGSVTYYVSAQLAKQFKGTLTSINTGTGPDVQATIHFSGADSLFETMEGTMQNIQVVAGLDQGKGSVEGSPVAGTNYGTIENCSVLIRSSFHGTDKVGGVAGTNLGTIRNTDVRIYRGCSLQAAYAGGIAGLNGAQGVVENCQVTGWVKNTPVQGNKAGALVGYNENTNPQSVTGTFKNITPNKLVGGQSLANP